MNSLGSRRIGFINSSRTFFRSLANHSTCAKRFRGERGHSEELDEGTPLARRGLVQAVTTAERLSGLASPTRFSDGTVGSRRTGRTRRSLRRRVEAGFTLIELMIVVVLISVLAVIAAPAMRVARDDRMAFDYARQVQQMATRARARAAARGGAHLLVGGPSGGRGRIWLFEALDGTVAPTGPNPVSSCRGVGQWAPVGVYNPAAPVPSNLAGMVDALELNQAINVDPDIKASFLITGPGNPALLVPAVAFALCVTPNGTSFAAEGADMATAITAMQSRPPFTGIAEVRITRSEGGAPKGLSRNVTLAGAAAARIHSL